MSAYVLLLLLTTNFAGGTSYVAVAYALKSFSTAPLVFWRTFLGGLLFLPFCWKTLRRRDLSLADWLLMAGAGVLGYAAPLLVGTAGQKLSSATNAALLMGVEPVSVVFLSALFLGEGLGARQMLALAVCIFGSVLIVLQGLPSWSLSAAPHRLGDCLLILQGFLWSLYTVMGKPVLKKVDALSFTAVTLFAGIIPLALFAAPHFGLPAPLSRPSLAAMAYLAFGVTFIGTLTWNKALELIPASRLANFIFLQPVLGVLGGVLLLKDHFSLWSGLGGGCILLGVYWAVASPAPAAAAPDILPS